MRYDPFKSALCLEIMRRKLVQYYEADITLSMGDFLRKAFREDRNEYDDHIRPNAVITIYIDGEIRVINPHPFTQTIPNTDYPNRLWWYDDIDEAIVESMSISHNHSVYDLR